MTPEEQARKFIAERLAKNQIGELSADELWQYCFGDMYMQQASDWQGKRWAPGTPFVYKGNGRLVTG